MITKILIIVIYNSIYLDIPKNEIISKHANESSKFLELSDGSLIHFRDEGNKKGKIILAVVVVVVIAGIIWS